MKHFRIRKGDWPSVEGSPTQVVSETLTAETAALLGTDYPGLRPKFEVAIGEQVTAGQVLFRDRKHPVIAFVSPITGRVLETNFGPRKTLSACIVEVGDCDEDQIPTEVPDGTDVRQTLLSRGFWPAFRTRPFGHIPAPEKSPAAIIINAVHAAPQAPDPRVVLADQMEHFRLGLQCLAHLTAGTVFVAQSPGTPLADNLDKVTCVAFSGSCAAGFASSHIDRLCPVSLERQVWTIAYQDVSAIGQHFQTGHYKADRVVALGGPAAHRTRLVRINLGARLADLCINETGETMSGSVQTGRRAAFLGRFDDQISLVEPQQPLAKAHWWQRFGGKAGVIIPSSHLERALAVDIPPVPLLRALAIGDSEAAMRLGCLSLVEEDVAALANRCTSGADYPRLLRHVLDELMAEAA